MSMLGLKSNHYNKGAIGTKISTTRLLVSAKPSPESLAYWRKNKYTLFTRQQTSMQILYYTQHSKYTRFYFFHTNIFQ